MSRSANIQGRPRPAVTRDPVWPSRRWRKLRVERLEARDLPAFILWDGGPGGNGTDWLTAVNWLGDVLPGPTDDVDIFDSGMNPTITLGANTEVRSVYSTLKQIFETVLAQSSRSFREVVLVEYPRRGLGAIGFVTGPTRGEIQARSEDELVNVFVPTTPNPTSGFLLFVPRKELIHLDMSIEEGIKLVISGGIVAPSQAATMGAREPRPQPVRGEPQAPPESERARVAAR